MYEYRQVIHRMRMGESDRSIAGTRLMGRIKCGQVRAIARRWGWLDRGTPLPDDEVLAEAFEQKRERDDNPTHQSLSRAYEEQIRKWVEGNVCMTTIHHALDWKGGPKTLFQPFPLAPLRRKSVAPLCRSLTPCAEAGRRAEGNDGTAVSGPADRPQAGLFRS